MVTVMQSFFVRPKSYSIFLTFKCQSTAVVRVGPLAVAEGHFPSCCLCRGFLEIRSLDFSEFQHGARNPYNVLPDRNRFFGKTFFTPNIWEMGQKIGLFEFKEKFGH